MTSPMAGAAGITRRRFLAGAGGLAAATVLGGSARRALAEVAPAADYPFRLGIASGDPRPDGVVLWTRLAPRPLAGGGMPAQPVPVDWQVATDQTFAHVVRTGVATATPQQAHSVHVEVGGLDPARWYWYRFRTGNHLSPVGRTQTAPAPGASPAALAFAFVSCQDWQNGYYTAYADLAAQDLDFVVHLGDYIYEYGPEGKTRLGAPAARVHEGPEVFSLDSYRNRHALYKTDPNLQTAHAKFPWLVVWDDHEVENDYASNTPEAGTSPPGDFAQRRANAYQAYYEHMPLRASSMPVGTRANLYRRLRFGSLAEVNLLDTRALRTDQPCGAIVSNCTDRLSPAQSMTGQEQERWLLDGLAASSTAWNVIAQQTMFAEVDLNPVPSSTGLAGLFLMDQWDGYDAQRRRIATFLASAAAPSNPVVISGDIHSSWVNDVKVDYGVPNAPVVATEFVGTSITSDSFLLLLAPALVAPLDNPHVRDFDGFSHGYVLCRLTPSTWTSDYRVVDTIDAPTSAARVRRRWVVEAGRPGAQPG